MNSVHYHVYVIFISKLILVMNYNKVLEDRHHMLEAYYRKSAIFQELYICF